MSRASLAPGYFFGVFLECVMFGECLMLSLAWTSSCVNTGLVVQVPSSPYLSLPAMSSGIGSRKGEGPTASWLSLPDFLD